MWRVPTSGKERDAVFLKLLITVLHPFLKELYALTNVQPRADELPVATGALIDSSVSPQRHKPLVCTLTLGKLETS